MTIGMRWRGVKCPSCGCTGTPVVNCCQDSVLTFPEFNYLDSYIVPRQDSSGTWHDQEMILNPIKFFASDVDWSSEDLFAPCAASQCKYSGTTLIETGEGSWDTSARWGLWDSLANPPQNGFGTAETGLLARNDFRFRVGPASTSLSDCFPDAEITLKAGQENDSQYYKRVLPPNVLSYLSGLTWEFNSVGGRTGTMTLRFPLYSNYCWPQSGGNGSVGYCNLSNATLTNGSYFNGTTTSSQSGGQSWVFYDSPNFESYLEIPFGGDTLQFRPSTVQGEESILYMHINNSMFFSEKFDISSQCNGSVTWSSVNNPSNYIDFDISGGSGCGACETGTVIPSGCCTLPDGTVSENSTATLCSAAGGTYLGDDTTCPPTGCCAIVGSSDLSDVTEAYCTSQGGTWTEGVDCTTGWCIDNTTGAITAGVEEDECTGTWSATEPTSGCCTVGSTDYPNVAESWCTGQSGTFVAGDCPAPSFDPCSETFTIAINSVSLDMDDPNFDLLNPFNLFGGTWAQPQNRNDPCSNNGVVSEASSVNIYGDQTDDPTALGPSSYFTAKYNSGTGLWSVTLTLFWVNNSNNWDITASKSGISLPSADCPSFSISGSFDTFSGNYQQFGGGNTFTVNDLVGSFNLTLTCD